MNYPAVSQNITSEIKNVSGVRLPKQKRSQISFDQMINSAMSLLEERGLEATTVKNILIHSGAGAGTFYARFDSRDALLNYLFIEFWEDTAKEWEIILTPPRWSTASVENIVVQITRTMVLWSQAHSSTLRAFLVYAMCHPEYALLDRTVELDNHVADHVIDLLIEHDDELTRPDLEQAVRLATLQVFATLRSRYIFAWGDRDDGIGDEKLALELAKIFLSYLGLMEAKRDGSHMDPENKPRVAHMQKIKNILAQEGFSIKEASYKKQQMKIPPE